MHLVRVGSSTFNLDNVTEVADYGDKLAVCFLAAWPNPDTTNEQGGASFACRMLYGDDADVMRRYVARLAEDAAAQVR